MKYGIWAIILFLSVELVWTNTLARGGRDVTATDLAIAKLRQENELLATQVASASALTTIAARAKASGFVAPTASQFVMMNATLPVAIARP